MGRVSGCFRARPWSPRGTTTPSSTVWPPPPLMTPSAPWPPVCSLTEPRYQQRTHTGSPAGRAHPNPDLHGMGHKKPPFFAQEEPLCTSRLLCRPQGRLQLTGQACRPQEGPWPADTPLKGRVHCMVGSWRQKRRPWPGLGSIRYARWHCRVESGRREPRVPQNSNRWLWHPLAGCGSAPLGGVLSSMLAVPI